MLRDGLLVVYHLGSLHPTFGSGDLTNTGGVTFVPGRFGRAAHFDGISDQYLSVPWGVLPSGEARTVSFWVYPTPAFWNAGWIGVGDTPDDSDGLWGFGKNAQSQPLFLWDDGSLALGSISSNVWHNVVMTVSAVDTIGNVTGSFYLDGVLLATQSTEAGIGRPNATLYIGAAGALSNGPFAGMLEELLIWGRDLSSHEVAEVYTLSSYPFRRGGSSHGKSA